MANFMADLQYLLLKINGIHPFSPILKVSGKKR